MGRFIASAARTKASSRGISGLVHIHLMRRQDRIPPLARERRGIRAGRRVNVGAATEEKAIKTRKKPDRIPDNS